MHKIVHIVDDLPTNIELVETVLKSESYITIRKSLNGSEFLSSIKNNNLPDLLILDLMMPVMSGFDVLKNLKEIRDDHYFPIIVLSGLADRESIKEALSLGADDYIIKPFFVDELKKKVSNMLKIKEREEIYNKLSSIETVMESNLLSKVKMIEHTQLEIIMRLGKAAEFRDDETGKHIERISDYVKLIAEHIGINREEVALIYFASPMHDVGKIGIPDSILLKPSVLTKEEFNVVKLHTIIGSRLLRGTSLPLLELAKEIAVSHHERWDGSGYPFGLEKECIPLHGRIVAIADVFDALTSHRVYKEPWSFERAFDYIKQQRERQFDPEIVDAFFDLSDKIIHIRKTKIDIAPSKPVIYQLLDGTISFQELIEMWR